MQRGERGVGFIVFVVIGVVALFSFVILTLNKPTGNVVDIKDFYVENSPFCKSVICPSGLRPYFLGDIGNYARCCCPESYTDASGFVTCRFEVRVPMV
ncbi:hypothetical protein DRJ22_00550 [Candidatus Woesearchaeota archaeon]|nr:MAG: hypothetical protein B6U93_00205 [Candidatus Woesearchaeota archaeon ex4484_78]RLE46982.1 MAG: hypothetical protein DRJ22_00550 [Candidatus Woesearchaeota archaeon]